MGFANDIIGGMAALVRAAIKSPNYVAGSTGWSVNKDGSAEFSNVTIRGTITASTFTGTTFVINSAGTFYYSGAPAAGNLVASSAAATGTDSHGNAYLNGDVTYAGGTLACQQTAGYSAFWSAASFAGPWTLIGYGFQSSIYGTQSSSVDSLQIGSSYPVIVPLAPFAPITAFDPTGAGGPAAWTTLTPLHGWAATVTLQAKLMPDNSVWVRGSLNPAAMTSTTFATLPTEYVPAVGIDMPMAPHSATPPTQGAFLRADNTGALLALNTTTTSGIFSVNMRVPLD